MLLFFHKSCIAWLECEYLIGTQFRLYGQRASSQIAVSFSFDIVIAKNDNDKTECWAPISEMYFLSYELYIINFLSAKCVFRNGECKTTATLLMN